MDVLASPLQRQAQARQPTAVPPRAADEPRVVAARCLADRQAAVQAAYSAGKPVLVARRAPPLAQVLATALPVAASSAVHSQLRQLAVQNMAFAVQPGQVAARVHKAEPAAARTERAVGNLPALAR